MKNTKSKRLSKAIFLRTVITLAAVITMSMMGCDNDNGINHPSLPPPALRAIPEAAVPPNAPPKVCESFSDGEKNWYLIDAGNIKDMYVSTIVEAHFNGITPVTLSRKTVTTTSITNAMKDTVTKSITISDTQNHTTGIGLEAAWKKKFPVAGEFSAKINLKYEWIGSWTNTNTESKSTETSVTEAQTFADEHAISITVGGHGEAAGWHRYAMYTTSDVYFIISTSLDNQELLSWDTIVCARDYNTPHMEYSPDGNWDNSPVNNLIIFEEDFYKMLPPPTGYSYSYTLTVVKNIENGGTVNPTSQLNISAVTPVSISAIPNSGYSFLNWTVVSGIAEFLNPNNQNTTVTLRSNATVRANFELKSDNILEAEQYPTNGGTVTPLSGTYSANTPINITATANSGFRFVRWIVVSGTATFGNINDASTTVALSSNAKIRAYFLPTNAAFGGEVGKLSLRVTGAFVARMRISHQSQDGVWRRTSNVTPDIQVNVTRTVDPGAHGIADGTIIRIYSWVSGGTDREGAQYFIYRSGSPSTASYTHSGTTLIGNTLTFNGVN